MEDDIYGSPDQAFADQIAADDSNKTFAQKFREARAQGKGTVFYWKGQPVAAYLKGEEPAAWTKSAAPPQSGDSGPSTRARRAPPSVAPTGLNDPNRNVYGANWGGMQQPDSGAIEQVAPEAYLMGGAGLARGVMGGMEALAAKQAARELARKQVAQRLGSGSSGLNERLADMSRRAAERTATSPTRKAMGSATRSTAEEGSSVVVKPRGMTPKTTTGETTSTTPIRPRGMTPKSTESPSAAPRPVKGMTPKSDVAPTAPRRAKGMTPKSDVAPSPARPTRGMNPKNRAPDDATDDIRDVVRRKGLGYAKGGSVRGGGIERRGRTKGRFVR